MTATLPDVCVLGLGKMGAAMALRLREHGQAVSLWNRSVAKAEELRDADLPGECIVSESAVAAVEATSANAAIILVLSDTAACLQTLEPLAAVLGGRTVVNLTSGSPQDGRRAAAALPRGAQYIDGAYCGPPAKARQGAGTLFLSSDDGDAEVERLRPALSLLGEIAFAGKVGASRALDYAVVDLALVCYSSFFSNLEMLQREGVAPAQLHEHMAKRLNTVAPAIAHLHARCEGERTDEAYMQSPVATLSTLHSFWSSRLPYFAANGIDDSLPKCMASLAERAADGKHWQADLTRMQEVMRPPASGPKPTGARKQQE